MIKTQDSSKESICFASFFVSFPTIHRLTLSIVRYFNANPNNYASFNVVLREPFESEVGGYIPKAVMPDTVYMLDTFKRAFNSVSAKKQEKCASIFSYLYYQIVEAVKDRENSHIKLAKQYMLSHLSEDVRLEEIANEVHLAPNYLCSVFKKDTGKTIMQYLAEQRIDLAKRLILTQTDELYKISELCGFSDYNHFSHTFKKGVILEEGNILNHAPTIAKILGLPFESSFGKCVNEILKA